MSAPPAPLDAVIGLGANLGDPRSTFESAAVALAATPGVRVVGRSALYLTEAIGPPQPDYRNAALRVTAALEPEALLDRMLEIERAHGRDRRAEVRWGPRTLDLDLLFIFDVTVESPRLRVPHPELERRAFALAPLLDVAPELIPRLGRELDALGGRPASEPW